MYITATCVRECKIFEPFVNERLYHVTFDDGTTLCLRVVRALSKKSLLKRIHSTLHELGVTCVVGEVSEGPARLFEGKLRPTLYIELLQPVFTDCEKIRGHREL